MANFDRSIDMLLAEGVVSIFHLDSIVSTYCGGRIYVGPFGADDTSVRTPQLSVSPSPTEFRAGVGGVSSAPVGLIVRLLEPYTRRPFAAGEVSSVCRIRRLQALMSRGSIEPSTQTYGNEGKVLNPDNPNSISAQTKWLNTAAPDFAPWTVGLMLDSDGKQPAALIYEFRATYETRLDNVTRLRA